MWVIEVVQNASKRIDAWHQESSCKAVELEIVEMPTGTIISSHQQHLTSRT